MCSFGRPFGTAALLLLIFAHPLPAAPTPPAPLSLARALTAAPPAEGLVLAVGAERVPLPAKAEPPPLGATVEDVAAAFGCQADTFGVVTAVAPTTKVVLNENPSPPDVSADLSPLEAFKMLAASLDDAQWQALTSESGLGLAALSDPTQQMLFHAFFRRGHLWIGSEDPELRNLSDSQRTDTRDLSDQIDSVRLRLGQTAKIDLHDRRGTTLFFSADPPGAAARLHTWHPKQDPPDTAHAVLLRAVIPNAPNDGDLHPDDAAFQVQVFPAGARTVGDLIARIAVQTHSEIYADPHYGKRTLTLLGPTASAPAGDLLRALALVVAGTYRQVGPAFVLTDALAGVGARRQRLADWEEIARTAETRLDDQAGQVMLAKRTAAARTLPSFGDPLALTPDQIAAMKDDPWPPGVPSSLQRGLPFAKLTAAQQAWGRRIAEEYDEQRNNDALPFYMKGDNLDEADLKGKVDLSMDYRVQMLIPSISTPVDTNLQVPIFMLYWPGLAAAEAHPPSKADIPDLPPAPPLASVLRLRPRRAVLGHPRSAADVDALVAAVRKLGLNELWLDVFSGGVAHLPGSRLSPKTSQSGPDILTEALTRTQGTGIAVYADLSLLPWGGATPDGTSDLTIAGETSAEAATQAHERNPEPDYDEAGKPIPFAPPPVVVSPASDRVREDLVALGKSVASHPGLAGFIWEDANDDDDLGYTLEMRLAFLRAAHADPIDITPSVYLRVDVSLPTFDDDGAEAATTAKWAEARQGALTTLLRQMRRALPPPAATLPVLMEREAVRTDWLASWDDPASPPPPLRTLPGENPWPSEETIATVATVARTQSRTTILRVKVENDGDTDGLARALASGLHGSAWGGFVLDFRSEAVTQGRAPLASLLSAVLTPPKPAPGKDHRPTTAAP